MAINRISNFSLLNGTLNDVGDVQKQLATLQEQISSGLKATNFQGINGQIEQYTQLEAKIRTATSYQNNNSVGIARLQTADSAMQQMETVIDSMKNLIIQARGGVGDTSSLVPQMQAQLQTLASQLNTSFSGKYIFGGTNTTDAPVPDATVKPASKGVPDNGYYAGAADDITYSADEGVTYQQPVRADDPAFQKIFAAAQQAIAAFGTGNDDADLKNALDMMQDGQQGVISARSALNTNLLNVQAANDRLTSLQTYWKGLSESVVNTDLVEASTKVSSYEAVLQATFQVYARLSSLRLSDYLK